MAGSRVEVEEGIFFIPTSGSTSNPSTGSEFVVSQGAVLDLTEGNSVLSGTYTGTGAGRVELSQGRIDTRRGATTLDFEEGLFHWTGGQILTDNDEGDAFVNMGHMSWSGAGTRELLGQEFHNQGTIVQSGDVDTLFASSGQETWFYNEPGSLYENIGEGGIVGGLFFNMSEFRNSVGNAEFNTDFRPTTAV